MAMRLAGESSPADALIDILTTKGDLFIRGAAEIERLGIGTKRFFPRVNEAGDGLEHVRGYEFGKNIRPWQWELAFFDWTTTVTGSGQIVYQGYGQFRPYTGTTATSTARGRGYMLVWPNYATEAFEWYIAAQLVSSTPNGQVWMKIDADTAADPTDKALGWRIDDNVLKGIVHNGTSLTVVDLSTTINDNQGAEYFLKFIPGSKVEWYVDGVKKGESANIPTTQLEASVYPVLAVANNADAAGQAMDLWRHGWILGA